MLYEVITSLQKQKTVRPLLKDSNSLDKLYAKRVELYKKYADAIVENNESVYKTCDEIISKYKEIF